MTSQEKATIVSVITQCINRVRQERHDYAVAADDVACKLAFLADWLTTIEVVQPGRITAATIQPGERAAHLAEESEAPDGE